MKICSLKTNRTAYSAAASLFPFFNKDGMGLISKIIAVIYWFTFFFFCGGWGAGQVSAQQYSSFSYPLLALPLLLPFYGACRCNCFHSMNLAQKG